MSLLLDTNVLLWLTMDSGDISKSFKQRVEVGLSDSSVAVSTITFVETTRLHRRGAAIWDAIPRYGGESG